MSFGALTKKPQKFAEYSPKDREKCLKEGYLEMSRINLSLAEEAVASDNDALALAEQNLRSVNKR